MYYWFHDSSRHNPDHSGYLWWKTRDLRKQFRNHSLGDEVIKGEAIEGEVIEGEVGAFACSCIIPPPDEEFAVTIKKAYDGSSSVVVAKAKSAEMIDRDNEITDFLVIRPWKGKLGDYFRTKINIACCICGISFELGETYLLYLYGPDEEGFYHTSICSMPSNFKSDRARKDIQILNELDPDQNN